MTLSTGMLWYAGNVSDSQLERAVNAAASYYASKYGVTPNLCHCHPQDATGQPERVGHVRLVKDGTVLRGHLWIGIETEKATA